MYKCNNVLVILVSNELNYNVLFRLDLEHFQDETSEGGRLNVPAVRSSNISVTVSVVT